MRALIIAALLACVGALAGCSTFNADVHYLARSVKSDLVIDKDYSVVQGTQAEVDAIAALGTKTSYKADAVADPRYDADAKKFVNKITVSERVRPSIWLLQHEVCHLEPDPTVAPLMPNKTDYVTRKKHNKDGVWWHTGRKDKC